MASNYPAAFDTDATLYRVANVRPTTLAALLTAGANSMTVPSTAGYPAADILRVERIGSATAEFVAYTSKTATTFDGLTRGAVSGYPAAAHSLGASVTLPVMAEHHNALNDAVAAIEGELGLAPSGSYATVVARLDALLPTVDQKGALAGFGTPTALNPYLTQSTRLDQVTAPTASVSLNGQRITLLGAPVADTDALDYGTAKAMLRGLDWQASVKNQTTTAPPGAPATGDRYVIASPATGAWVGLEEKIAEWSGTAWIYSTPNEGFSLEDESLNRLFIYNDAWPTGTWIDIGGAVDHGALTGLADDDHPQYQLRSGKDAASGYAGLTAGTKLNLAQMQEVMGALDLSDISAKSGTGTTVLFQDTPTLLTPTIASFANANHSHLNVAGGGTLDHGAALTGLADDDHTQYLLATGTRAGATAQAQDFTSGISVGGTTLFEADRDLAVSLVANANRALNLGSTARYFQELFATKVLTRIDARAYGVVADGVTDDLAAAQAALNAATQWAAVPITGTAGSEVVGGAVVVFPSTSAGIRLSGSLTCPPKVVIGGPCRFVLDAGVTGFNLDRAVGSDKTWVRFDDVAFTGGAIGVDVGYNTTGIPALFQACKFVNQTTAGIKVGNTSFAVGVRDSVFTGCNYGLWNAGTSNDMMQIDHCVFLYNSNYDIYIQSANVFRVTNNDFVGNQKATLADRVNLYVEVPTGSEAGSYSVIENNKFGQEGRTDGNCIRFVSTSGTGTLTSCSIQNNLMQFESSASGKYAIKATTVRFAGVTIAKNSLTYCDVIDPAGQVTDTAAGQLRIEDNWWAAGPQYAQIGRGSFELTEAREPDSQDKFNLLQYGRIINSGADFVLSNLTPSYLTAADERGIAANATTLTATAANNLLRINSFPTDNQQRHYSFSVWCKLDVAGDVTFRATRGSDAAFNRIVRVGTAYQRLTFDFHQTYLAAGLPYVMEVVIPNGAVMTVGSLALVPGRDVGDLFVHATATVKQRHGLVYTAASVPTAGYFPVGATAFSTAPTPGLGAGWINTAAGSPGTWREFAPMKNASGLWQLDGGLSVTSPGSADFVSALFKTTAAGSDSLVVIDAGSGTSATPVLDYRHAGVSKAFTYTDTNSSFYIIRAGAGFGIQFWTDATIQGTIDTAGQLSLTRTGATGGVLLGSTGLLYSQATNVVGLGDGDSLRVSATGTVIMVGGANIVLDATTGTKIGTATTEKLGFWNATPVARPAAYTQTYATATRTHANPTAVTLTDNSTGTASDTINDAGIVYSQTSQNNFRASITDEVNKLVADLANLKQVVNSLLDDGQTVGLLA